MKFRRAYFVRTRRYNVTDGYNWTPVRINHGSVINGPFAIRPEIIKESMEEELFVERELIERLITENVQTLIKVEYVNYTCSFMDYRRSYPTQYRRPWSKESVQVLESIRKQGESIYSILKDLQPDITELEKGIYSAITSDWAVELTCRDEKLPYPCFCPTDPPVPIFRISAFGKEMEVEELIAKMKCFPKYRTKGLAYDLDLSAIKDINDIWRLENIIL